MTEDLVDPDTSLEADWVCVHTFLDAAHDEFITDCIGPLALALTEEGHVQRWFFLRYWEGGPHVRLRLLPHRRADRAAIERRAVETVNAYLAANPVPDLVDRVQFAANAANLAELEGRTEYDSYVRPNNHVEVATYAREHADYGRGAAIAVVEKHFHDSSLLALKVLQSGAPVPLRANVAFDLMVANFAMCDDLRDRWSAIAGLSTPFGTGEESPDVIVQYERQKESLRDRLAATWRLTDRVERREDVGDGYLAFWLRSQFELRERLGELEDDGTFTTEWPESPLARPLDLPSTRHPGTLLVLLRCAHLVVNRMGLSLWEEVQVRYLVGYVLKDHPQLLVRS